MALIIYMHNFFYLLQGILFSIDNANFIALSICSSDKNLLLFVIDQMCSHKLNVNWTDLLLWLWQDGYVLYAYDKIELISDFLVLFRIDVYMQSLYA